jgi:O-antigen chain-terminating methyltransferase
MPAHLPSQPDAVETLIDEMRYAARAYRARLGVASTGAAGAPEDDTASLIDGPLAELWRRSQPRTELPQRFRRFPLTIAPIGKLALRVYNLLNREQRAACSLMCDALKALQSALAQRQAVARENAILIDYVRAQLRHAGSVGGASAPPMSGPAEAEDSGLDDLFVALGDRFRGAPELIADRLRVYLPLLGEVGIKGPVLDLGCGRGEWLELMREAHIAAVGVEHNRVLVEACARKSLEVVEADLTAFLRQSAPEHWQLITAFHVIEHLGWPQWLAFMRDIHRALCPGGLAILETPNPGNVVTAANRFHLDPTHRQPIPSALLELVATHVGFDRIDIMPLHVENEAAAQVAAAGMPPEIIDRLFGAQDYALVARR